MEKRKKRRKLPTISIITPSYNQGQFIEQTINSVLSQEYPYLEYIVMDGGSTDCTIEILRKHRHQLKFFSEKDKGQSHAINKGLKMTTGQIIGYLNSDDYLERRALLTVGKFFQKHETAKWVTGKCKVVNEKDQEVRKLITCYKNFLLKYIRSKTLYYIIQFISQPATFWRRSVIKTVGYFDEKLNYDMDYDYWLMLWQRHQLYFIDDYLASYRVHPLSKAVTSPETQFKVEYEIASRFTNSKIILFLHRLHYQLALMVYKVFFSK